MDGVAIGDFPGVAHASFLKGTGWLLAGSTQSKQLRVELLYNKALLVHLRLDKDTLDLQSSISRSSICR